MKINQTQIDKLVREAKKGNAKAFGEIYDAYFVPIHKYVFYRVSEEHVDDVVGTIFIKAWTRLKKYKKTNVTFGAWLFRVAHNTVIDHYRTHKQFYELEERIADDHEKASPQRHAERVLNGERVQRALRSLGDKYQEVIILKYMNEMSNKDVAKVMRTNESNVRTLQFRALKKLKTELEEEDRLIARKLEKEAGDKPAGVLRRLFARSS